MWRHWMVELSRGFTLIRYDQRGCGLSDWNVTDFSLDAFVRDLRRSSIRWGSRCSLCWASRRGAGGAHLYGTTPSASRNSCCTARSRWAQASSSIPGRDDEHEALITLIRLCWGRDDPSFRQLFAAGFIPGASPEQHRWFNDLCRVSTSPENAARFRRAFGDLDVSELLPGSGFRRWCSTPWTKGRVPVAEGKRLAATIPGARFVPLQGNNHILLEDEPAWPRSSPKSAPSSPDKRQRRKRRQKKCRIITGQLRCQIQVAPAQIRRWTEPLRSRARTGTQAGGGARSPAWGERRRGAGRRPSADVSPGGWSVVVRVRLDRSAPSGLSTGKAHSARVELFRVGLVLGS